MKKIALITFTTISLFTGCTTNELEDRFASKTFRMDSMFGTKFLTTDSFLKWTMSEDGKVLPNSKIQIEADKIIFYHNDKPVLKTKYLYDSGVVKFDVYEANSKKTDITQIWIDESKSTQFCYNYVTQDAIDYFTKGKKELDCDDSLTYKINQYYTNKFKALEANKK